VALLFLVALSQGRVMDRFAARERHHMWR